jgi:hypothetical protein
MLRRPRPSSLARFAVLVLVTSFAACATAPPPRALGPADLPDLAGTWNGRVVTRSGTALPAELTIQRDGTYVGRWGASRVEGRITAHEGQVVFQNTAISGPQGTVGGTPRGGATLHDGAGGRMLLGESQSELGPLTFELTQSKR